MYQAKKSLANPYYFINDNVLYDISNYQDNDKCGKKLVAYNEDKRIDEEKCAKTFPCFIVNYTSKDEKTTYNVYYWLQDLIQDGDKFLDGKFTQKAGHHKGDYILSFVDGFRADVKFFIQNGMSLTEIKKEIPYYCFAPSSNKEKNKKKIVLADGKTTEAYYCGVSGFMPITDDEILDIAYDIINISIVEKANKLLSPYQKRLKESATTVIVDKDKVEDIK